MEYIVGLVSEMYDRLPDGHISGSFEMDRTEHFSQAIRYAQSLDAGGSNFHLNEDNREVVVYADNNSDGEKTVLWSSRDSDRMKFGYLEYSSSEWQEETSGRVLCPQSGRPSVYFDIDGTLGKWYADGRGYSSLEEIIDPDNHYFRDIEPHEFMIDLAKALQDAGYDVCILSAADRNTMRDKMEWVQNNLPFIPDENIFFSPLGADKSQFVKGNAEYSILIDDYVKNLDSWRGYRVKAINTVNTHQDIYPEIDMTEPEELLQVLHEAEGYGNMPEAALEKMQNSYQEFLREAVLDISRMMDEIEQGQNKYHKYHEPDR